MCKNKFDDIFFFQHELSSYIMFSLLSKFKRFHRVVFLVEGALYQFWHTHFSKDFAHEYWSLHCTKTNSITYSFFIINYLLMLCLVYYQNFKRFHRVVFLVEGALFPFWHIFWRFRSKIWRPSLCKNKFDDIFFFHPKLSSYAMFSFLSRFEKNSPCSFVSRGRFIPTLAHFLKISLTNIEAFIVQKQIRWYFLFFTSWIFFYDMLSLLSKFEKISPHTFLSRGRFIPILAHFLKILLKIWRSSLCKNEVDDTFFFHHELFSYAMLSLLSKFQKISPCSFLRRGRFIPILAHFLKISLKHMKAFIVQKRIQWYFLFSSWIIFLCYAYSAIKISKDFTVKFC